MIPRIGAKSLALLCELKGEKLPDVEMLHRKAKRFHSFVVGVPSARAPRSCTLLPSAAPR